MQAEFPLCYELKQASLDFKRPLFEQIMIPSLILVVLLFIIFLSIVDNIDTYVEGGLAAFFGIFGLKQMILPPDAEIRTIIDYAIWGLYFAFAGTLIQQFFFVIKQAFKKPSITLGEDKEQANIYSNEYDDDKLSTLSGHSYFLPVLKAFLFGLVFLWIQKRIRKIYKFSLKR